MCSSDLVPAASRAGVPGGSPRIFASPLARKLAKEGGVDLNGLTGSGPGGRIVQRDLAAPKPSAPKRIEVPVAPLVPSDAGTLIPHNNIRRITGERLTQAWSTIPHIYLTIDCVIDALMRTRASLNERAGDHYKLSVNDFVIRAVAFALRKVPEMNAQYTAAGTLQLSSVDVAVAVALKNGLITPIIRHADQKGLAEISSEMRALADKA